MRAKQQCARAGDVAAGYKPWAHRPEPVLHRNTDLQSVRLQVLLAEPATNRQLYL